MFGNNFLFLEIIFTNKVFLKINKSCFYSFLKTKTKHILIGLYFFKTYF